MTEFPFSVRDSLMAGIVRSYDWSKNPLGPPLKWMPELRTLAAHVLESRFPTALVWGERQIFIYNDAFRPMLGEKPEALGRPFHEVWSDVWDMAGPLVRRAYEGECIFIENYAVNTDRSGVPEAAYFTFCLSPVRAADGRVCGLMDTVIETTAVVLAEQQRELLLKEMSHRLKNTLQVVQAIAAQTLKDVKDRDAVRSFNQRLSMLGKAHDILLRHESPAASLLATLDQIVSLIDDKSRISYRGADLLLAPKGVLTISLALYELATNAMKHGALSTAEGRVHISWIVKQDEFRLLWDEFGGPKVTAPERTGFGSRLLNVCFGEQAVARRFLPEGVEVELVAPLRVLTDVTRTNTTL